MARIRSPIDRRPESAAARPLAAILSATFSDAAKGTGPEAGQDREASFTDGSGFCALNDSNETTIRRLPGHMLSLTWCESSVNS